jgi:hypothetical protein
MATHDWATWHINNQTKNVKCQMLTRPPIRHVPYHLSPYLPSQPTDIIPATSACAMCHPYSCDTCHPMTSPIVCHMPHHLPHVISRSCHIICMDVRPVQSACQVALYGLYSHPLFLPVWVFRYNVISFAYRARSTK